MKYLEPFTLWELEQLIDFTENAIRECDPEVSDKHKDLTPSGLIQYETGYHQLVAKLLVMKGGLIE